MLYFYPVPHAPKGRILSHMAGAVRGVIKKIQTVIPGFGSVTKVSGLNSKGKHVNRIIFNSPEDGLQATLRKVKGGWKMYKNGDKKDATCMVSFLSSFM